ncbi:response regulator transcription factor [Roseivirga sp. E12]|uniref:response regulator transcription factor n=1 Tax=Roseivirga sp. E12 TaxID=2819237 RepID=UPI001ABCBEFF|nr:response regulator transcription factor [Roseivirga sp. E12]MBO3698009.1 response regulator transcription factor [Roseivirga sp. E12]
MAHSPYTLSPQTDQVQRTKKSNLTEQELKVLTFMADGYSNTQIAESLFISENTVKTHISRIFAKLEAKRRTEAVKIGRDLKII